MDWLSDLAQTCINPFRPSLTEAKQDIERCKKEDGMYETAKQLVDIAVKVHMRMFGVDRETARYWVCSASEVVD